MGEGTGGPASAGLPTFLDMLLGAEPEGAFVNVRRRGGSGFVNDFLPVRERASIRDQLEQHGAHADTYVAIAPRRERSGRGDAVERVHVLYATQLLRRRETLLRREPGQFKHDGSPLEDGSEAAAIDREIAALGDIVDLESRYVHSRRLEDAEKARVEAFVTEHYAEILEGWQPTAEAVAADVTARARELTTALEEYMAAHRRSSDLTRPIPGIDGRHVPGINRASELQRAVAGMELPPPIPPTGWGQ